MSLYLKLEIPTPNIIFPNVQCEDSNKQDVSVWLTDPVNSTAKIDMIQPTNSTERPAMISLPPRTPTLNLDPYRVWSDPWQALKKYVYPP